MNGVTTSQLSLKSFLWNWNNCVDAIIKINNRTKRPYTPLLQPFIFVIKYYNKHIALQLLVYKYFIWLANIHLKTDVN